MYRLYHDCARTLKRSLSGKLALVELSGDFGFARNSSKCPCSLASFSCARMPRSACTCDVTCELYCMSQTLQQQSLIFVLSKCAIKIGIEKLYKKFDCFVKKLVLCQQGRFYKIRSQFCFTIQ